MAVCKVHCIVCYVVFASQIQSHTHIPSAIPSNSSSAAKQSKNEWMRNDASVWVYILLLLCFYLHCMCLCLFLCIQITTLWCVDFYLRFSNFFLSLSHLLATTLIFVVCESGRPQTYSCDNNIVCVQSTHYKF